MVDVLSQQDRRATLQYGTVRYGVGCVNLRFLMGPSSARRTRVPRIVWQVRHPEANEASPQPSKSKKTVLPCRGLQQQQLEVAHSF